MDAMNIMVTGAGSGVGQGIIKALNISKLPNKKIIAADIAPLNAALYRADEGLIIPKVEDEGTLDEVISIVKRKNIKVIMIGSEFDLEFFSQHKEHIEKETEAKVIVSSFEMVEIADDKWLTAEFLRTNNLPYAESYLPDSLDSALQQSEQWGYPLIIKTRRGTSSRHVHVVMNDHELANVYSSIPNPFLQKIIDLPSKELAHEYTCSIFMCKDRSILGPFTARRTLRGGSSWVVEVGHFTNLYPLLLSIGKLMPAMGTLNIQLMVGPQGPIPFEFNARFSGTTAVRAHFGFNEPEMAIRSFILGEKIEPPEIRTGLALRYLEEVFIENGNDIIKSDMPLHKGVVRDWF